MRPSGILYIFNKINHFEVIWNDSKVRYFVRVVYDLALETHVNRGFLLFEYPNKYPKLFLMKLNINSYPRRNADFDQPLPERLDHLILLIANIVMRSI